LRNSLHDTPIEIRVLPAGEFGTWVSLKGQQPLQAHPVCLAVFRRLT